MKKHRPLTRASAPTHPPLAVERVNRGWVCTATLAVPVIDFDKHRPLQACTASTPPRTHSWAIRLGVSGHSAQRSLYRPVSPPPHIPQMECAPKTARLSRGARHNAVPYQRQYLSASKLAVRISFPCSSFSSSVNFAQPGFVLHISSARPYLHLVRVHHRNVSFFQHHCQAHLA